MKQQQDGQQESNQAELIEITEALRVAQEKAVHEDRQWKQIMSEAGEPQKYNFRDYDQSQVYFVPVRLNNFLETEHPARVIDIIVEKMDLSSLYERYSDEGNPPYHPKMMLKVLFYAYYRGVRSCRQIRKALVFRSDLYLPEALAAFQDEYVPVAAGYQEAIRFVGAGRSPAVEDSFGTHVKGDLFGADAF